MQPTVMSTGSPSETSTRTRREASITDRCITRTVRTAILMPPTTRTFRGPANTNSPIDGRKEMPARADQMVELIRQVTSLDMQQRELGADRVTDWVNSYSRTDGRVLASVLSAAAACETAQDLLQWSRGARHSAAFRRSRNIRSLAESGEHRDGARR